MRAAGRVALIALALAICLPAHLITRALGRPSRWPRRFLGATARAAGLEIRVVGAPLARDTLIVANHVSWLDILALADAANVRFVAKAEVADWPLIGSLAALNDTLYVARAEKGRVREQADALATALADGRPVALFAEGTTGDGDTIRPLRASLFAAVAPPPAGVCVQPALLDYGADAASVHWPDEESAGANAWRLLGLPGRRQLTIRFLAPFDPALLPDRKAIAAEVQARLAVALGEARAERL